MVTAMKQLDQFIKKNIVKARRWITLTMLVDYVMIGLLAGLGAGTIIMLISLFVPMYYAGLYATACLLIGLLTGCIITLVKRPNMTKASLMLDAKGFRERITTAYLATGKDDAFSMMVKQDAKAHLTGYSVAKAFPVKLQKKQTGALLCMAVIFLIAMQIETPAKQQAREQQAVVEAAKEKVVKVEKTLDELEKLEKNQQLSKEDLDKLKQDLESVKKELKEAESEEDLAKAAERAEKKLEQNLKNMASENNMEAMQSLMNLAMDMNDSLTEEEKNKLAEKMESLSELQEQLEKAEQEGIDGLTEEEKAALAESLKKAAAELDMDELQALADKLANGEQISAEDLQEVLASISAASNQTIAEAMEGDASVGIASSGSSDGTGEGQNGNGNGGNGGSGQNGNGGSGGQGGTGWNYGGEDSYERDETYDGDYVTVPDNYQDDPNLKGDNTDGESYVQEGGPAITWDGEKKDYRDVIDEYEDQAFEKIDGGDYPEEVRDFIKDYFEYLNQ